MSSDGINFQGVFLATVFWQPLHKWIDVVFRCLQRIDWSHILHRWKVNVFGVFSNEIVKRLQILQKNEISTTSDLKVPFINHWQKSCDSSDPLVHTTEIKFQLSVEYCGNDCVHGLGVRKMFPSTLNKVLNQIVFSTEEVDNCIFQKLQRIIVV